MENLMTENDKKALELGMKILERHPTWGPALQKRLEGERYATPHPLNGEWIMRPQPWREVAEFAADICQTESLNLMPWEQPPCRPGVDCTGNDASLKLAAKMEAAGVSRWHPDPLRALEEANALAD
jgi:hypothetical protein